MQVEKRNIGGFLLSNISKSDFNDDEEIITFDAKHRYSDD